MLLTQAFVTLVTAIGAVSAVKPPSYSGYTGQWTEQFAGAVDSKPNSDRWTIISTSDVFNNEWQTYTSSKKNVRVCSAVCEESNDLQLVPHHYQTSHRS